MPAVKKSKGLGRGLDALLGDSPRERAAAQSAAPGQERGRDSARGKTVLPVAFLTPNPDQPRRVFNDDAIEELAASIRARGLLQPILVRPLGPDSYEIVAGERRWRAAQKARLHDVPVIVRELDDDAAAEIALIENVQRVDLNPVEEARAYQRLSDVHGRSQEQIAKAVGKSRSHVANIMRLNGLPPGCMEALSRGEIAMGHARALLTAERPDALCMVVIAKGLTVRQTEELAAMDRGRAAPEKRLDETRPEGARGDGTREGTANGSRRGGGPAPERKGGGFPSADGKSAPAKKDADTRALEADLAAALGLEVAIEHSPKGYGVVAIRYLDLDQLDEVCKRLMDAGV